MKKDQDKMIKFAAVGDLLLTARSNQEPGRGFEVVSDDIQSFFNSCNLVFANLECTLEGEEKVPTEPRVLATEKQVLSLKNSGIQVVSLGNNHTFDCYDQGFIKLGGLLNDIGIRWCGAGFNIKEALEATVFEIQGIRLAILCIVDPSSGMFRFAEKNTSGVAPIDVIEVCRKITELKESVDHVIVSPHWGMERYRIPSPEQMSQARAFVDAGASMVLGHHPHVVQGMEMVQQAPVVYSLGNFMSSHVYWDNGEYLNWSRFERVGCIFCCSLNENTVSDVIQIPVYDNGISVEIDKTGWGDQCIQKVNRLLASGVNQKKYNCEAFWVSKVKPVVAHLNWDGIKKIRPKHFAKLYRHIRPK